MSDFNEGDLVEAVKGERRVTDRIRKDEEGDLFLPGAGYVVNAYTGLNDAEDAGYTFKTIEKATPPLPTDTYTVIKYEPLIPLMLHEDGLWYFVGSPAHAKLKEAGVTSAAVIARYGAGFHTYQLESVTAKRVAEEFVAAILAKNDGQTGNTYKLHVATLMEIADRFGATE